MQENSKKVLKNISLEEIKKSSFSINTKRKGIHKVLR